MLRLSWRRMLHCEILGPGSNHNASEYLRVNGANHAALAVLALRAVVPDRCSGVDHESIGGHLLCSRGHELKAGEEACGVRHDHVDWHAWVGKGGLCDGVVAASELELHHVAHVGLDVVRAKHELLARAVRDGDDMHRGSAPFRHGAAGHGSGCTRHLCKGTAGKEEGGGDRAEMHLG